MSDFIKKYFPFYILWLLFFSFVAVGLQISTGVFSAILPTGSAFTIDFLENMGALLWDIVTFRGDGVPGLIATMFFFIPSLPMIVWLIEMIGTLIVGILNAIIPF
jgi:hypothetical protein